nr:hypothetical protein [Candidatus Sigynarchaeota archaeon]
MVCWSDNLDWRKILGALGLTLSEEDKSNAIWELQDEMGHDYLASLSDEELEKLMIDKLREMTGEGKKRKKKGKNEHQVEENATQSYYI